MSGHEISVGQHAELTEQVKLFFEKYNNGTFRELVLDIDPPQDCSDAELWKAVHAIITNLGATGVLNRAGVYYYKVKGD